MKTEELALRLSCGAGIAQIKVTAGDKTTIAYQSELFAETEFAVLPSSLAPLANATCDGLALTVSFADLETQFDRTKRLSMTLLGLNGKKRVCDEVWKMLAELPFIRVPGTSVVLRKTSVKSDELQSQPNQKFWRWAMLLHRKGPDGTLVRANAIDLRVGAIMDGAVVHYEDGTHVNCGPVSRNGRPHHFGGHASQKRDLPVDASIAKVQINSGSSGWGCLNGIRMTLDTGKKWGELNGQANATLQPADDERIVGFFGQSDLPSGFAYEFGIITAKKGVELPMVVYDMPELQNLEGAGMNEGVVEENGNEREDDDETDNNSEDD